MTISSMKKGEDKQKFITAMFKLEGSQIKNTVNWNRKDPESHGFRNSADRQSVMGRYEHLGSKSLALSFHLC